MEKKTRYAAQIKYNKQNILRKELKLNYRTDAEMINYVLKIQNFNRYMKTLISEDMKKNEQ